MSDEDRITGLVRDLTDRVRREHRMVVAFSGGADSALLAAVAPMPSAGRHWP